MDGLGFVDMPYKMPQLGKDKSLAGQLAGFHAAGHTKQDGIFKNSRRGAGQQGRRIDLVKAELGKQRAECCELLCKQRAHGLNGNIFTADTGTPGNEYSLCFVVTNSLYDSPGNGFGIVRHNQVLDYFVPFLASPLAYPETAFIILQRSGA